MSLPGCFCNHAVHHCEFLYNLHNLDCAQEDDTSHNASCNLVEENQVYLRQLYNEFIFVDLYSRNIQRFVSKFTGILQTKIVAKLSLKKQNLSINSV